MTKLRKVLQFPDNKDKRDKEIKHCLKAINDIPMYDTYTKKLKIIRDI